MTPERWRRVEEIFQSAMDRDAPSRLSWVEAACDGDEELRQEVTSLIAFNTRPVIVDEPAYEIAADLLEGDFDLPPGTTIGPYRIEARIGAGGMGSVYRAVDSRLHRPVAIKVCEAEWSERFEREAKAVAALNHPNVCTLHDIGPNYLVMELLEGPTLADRIRQGPISFAEAMAIARQIGAALDFAHERGIVHRDLKPANVKFTADGVVKVLDFGLATFTGASPESQGSEDATKTLATEAGTVLGTAPYMSPEQVRGQTVDKRTDIWAFGAVLYEMLAGRRPFDGETWSDVTAAVLTNDPDWDAVPAEVRPLLKACLEKNPKQRLRDIGDVWRLLDTSTSDEVVARSHSRAALVAAAIIAVVAMVAGWGWWRATRRPALSPMVLEVDLGQNAPGGIRSGSDVVLSPDGSRVVYVANDRLFTRRLEELNATELAQTEGATAPFFSPDGEWVGFFAGHKLKKVLLSAGTVEIICGVGLDPRGGSWGDDGNIVLARDNTGVLSRIPAAGGGEPAPITRLEGPSYRTHRWPQVLPGSRKVLFTEHASPLSGFDEAGIAVVDLQERRQKLLIAGGTYGRYLPSGHLLYVKGGALFAVPFDLGRLEVRGKPVRILDGVAYSNANGTAQFDVAGIGTLVYRSGGSERVRIEWLDASGARRPILREPGEYLYPTLSPDGGRVAYVLVRGARQELWTYDWRRDVPSRLTGDELFNTNPCWTPSGRYLLYQAPAGMNWVAADGSGASGILLKSEDPYKKLLYAASFSPAGDRLAYYVGSRDLGGFDLWTAPFEENATEVRAGAPEPFIRTPADERHPAFSPDGRWIAFESNESGIAQVYVVSYPDKMRRVQISSDGGAFPTWSRAHKELFFRSAGQHIMVAGYETKGRSFTPGKPRVWSDAPLAERPLSSRNFSMSADGTRAAVLMPEQSAQPAPANRVVFVLNFFDELRRRIGS